MVLPGTWEFKLKRFTDGTRSKFKSRYCVRGNKQIEGVDPFDTYSQVVQWSTFRLVLTMVFANNWTTRQVDYPNIFGQVNLKEEVYIERPRGFLRNAKKDLVLLLLNSLYGLKQAFKSFFEKISEGLLERGFVQLKLDKHLFMKKYMICITYIDDTILAGLDAVTLEEVIKNLGITEE